MKELTVNDPESWQRIVAVARAYKGNGKFQKVAPPPFTKGKHKHAIPKAISGHKKIARMGIDYYKSS